MAIASNQPVSVWRDFVAWSAVAAIPYILAMGAALSLMHRDGLRAIVQPGVAPVLGLSLIAAMAVVGLSRRKRPVTPRNLRNFLVADSVAVSLFLLAAWSFRSIGAARAMGASEAVAAFTGLVLLICAMTGMLFTASARTGADLIGDEDAAEEMRDRSLLYFYSFIWMGMYGLLLIGLSLAGRGDPLPPVPALAGALALVLVLVALGIAVWRMSDELGRTLSHETGNMAFYLILALGGGWAILAHLGFVAAPAPLDWLTLFTVLLFAASFIVLGRRKLLTR